MSTNFPTTLDSFSTKNNGDVIDASHIDNLQDSVFALETKVGADSSAVTTSLDYKLTNTASSNPGHKHTLSSLTDFNVTSPSAGQALVYNGSKWSNTGGFKFGGTGADGALSLSSGTTNLDIGNAAIFVKNYTSISLTGTAKITFTNPNTNGTLIILRSQGNVILTSSQTPMIDSSGLGGAGGSGGNTNVSGTDGSISGSPIWVVNSGQGGQYHSAGGTAGALPTNKLNSTIFASLYTPYLAITPGAGGGGGESATASAIGGNGGNGGGALVIECGGALNFTTTSGISVNGSNGGNGTPNATNTAGGGGGGGGGMCLILYNSLTSASGTITVAGGTGGNCVSAGGTTYGGGGGASSLNAGVNGTSSATNGAKTGGNGGAGSYSIVQNYNFA